MAAGFDPNFVPEGDPPPEDWIAPTWGLDELDDRIAAHAEWLEATWGLAFREPDGTEGWHVFAKRLRGKDCGLSGAEISYGYVSLDCCRLVSCNLSGAVLRGAGFAFADLSYCDLSDVDLGGANLQGANLKGANLSGTNLRGARLIDAVLTEARTDKATCIEGAKLHNTRLPESLEPHAGLIDDED